MRVTGGTFRGRKIYGVPGMDTRPTSDKTRQAIFNILMNDTEQARVLDLFAGSGALGIDALSRGAADALFIESGRKPVEMIKRNLKSLDLPENVVEGDYREACRMLSDKNEKYDLIFADPPYDLIAPMEVMETVVQYDLLSPDGILIIEHKYGRAGQMPGELRLLKKRKFGQTEVSFYARSKKEK